MAGLDRDPDTLVCQALRAGDPAALDSLAPQERDAICAGLLREAAARAPLPARAGWWRWRPAFAAGLTMLLLAVLWVRTARAPHSQANPMPVAPAVVDALPAPAQASSSSSLAASASNPVDVTPRSATKAARQAAVTSNAPAPIRMITRGGTRIVWSVNPGARF
jgi:hypothetical protein